MRGWLSVLSGMGPELMALHSAQAQEAHGFLAGETAGMKNEALKAHLSEMFACPLPALPNSRKERKEIYHKLIKAGYLDAGVSFAEFVPELAGYEAKPPPVWVASGSHYRGHHAYPGGLVVHTAKNLRVALANARLYGDMYGLPFERDILVFAQVAHDLAKTWLLLWQEDASCLPQYPIAGAGAHHVFGLAESVRRGVAPEAVVAQAATHVNPESKRNRAAIGDFLRAACIIADTDPAEYSFGDASGRLAFDGGRIEYWCSYIGDHMVIFTVQAARRMVKLLKELAIGEYAFSMEEAEGKAFNQFRNYLFCQLGMEALFPLLDAADLKTLGKRVGAALGKLKEGAV